MGKLEYLNALKRAMTGLEPEIQARTLAFYEQRFVDGVAIGRTEEDVAKELDDPKKIAMTLRANTHLKAFETKKNPANFVRMMFAAIGLAIFNLFMVVPAMVYAALLASLYATGLAFYLGGAVITGSGLSGNNEIKLDGPLGDIFVSDDNDPRGQLQTKVNISEQGIRIFTEREQNTKPSPSPDVTVTMAPGKADDNSSRASAREAARVAKEAARTAAKARAVAATAEASTAIAATQAGAAAVQADAAAVEAGAAAVEAGAAAIDAEAAAMDAAASAGDAEKSDSKRSVRVIKRAESVASHGLTLSTDADGDSRATQIVIGLAMVLGGIILLLLSLVITHYTFIGIKRYIDMNVALLKGN